MSDPQRTAADLPLPGGNFRLFIQRLGYQCLMSLGVIENPITNTKQQNLDSARMLLDDLQMLKAKTAGNLDPEEEAHLAKMLGDLEVAYERDAKQGGGDAAGS